MRNSAVLVLHLLRMEAGEGSRDAAELSAPGQAWGPPTARDCIPLWELRRGIAGTDPYLPKIQECCEGKRGGEEGSGLLRVKDPCTPAFSKGPVCECSRLLPVLLLP